MGVAEEAAAAVVGINAMLAVARLAILLLVLPCAACTVASRPHFTPMTSGGGNDGGGGGGMGGSGGM
jgi:hypothetical protein